VDGTKSLTAQHEDLEAILISTTTPNWQVSGAVLAPVSVANGGTGGTTFTGLLDGNGTSAMSAITSSTVGQVLRVTGANTFAFGATDLADTDAVTGVLPVANGGSGSATPTESIYIPAGSMDVEGTCALGTAAVLVTTGPKLATITCADSNTDGIDLDVVMPDGWNASTITVELAGFYGGTPTAGQIFAMNWSGQCVRSGDPVAAWTVTSGATATSGSNVATNLTMVATANLEYQTTSAALTLGGTCAAGAHVYLHGLVNATTTNLTTIANLKILGVKLEYQRNAND
jgi:hypothetical protein